MKEMNKRYSKFALCFACCFFIVWIMFKSAQPVLHANGQAPWRRTNATRMLMLMSENATVEPDLDNGTVSEACYKRVYTWYNLDDTFYYNLVFHGNLGEFECPGLPCTVSLSCGQNYSQLAASDVVLLFYKSAWDWDEIMKYRSARQKWIFWTSESPKNTDIRVIPPPQYNAIAYDYLMTYRIPPTKSAQDAWLVGGNYGSYIDSQPMLQDGESKNWASNKTKMAAWVVSNFYPPSLSWKRTEFVRALQKYVEVDIYGPHGTLKCDNLDTCGLQQYKFYLALENSECEDYVTEKFWHQSLHLGLLPIVYGPAKSDYLKVAPPNSFIHVQDFTSVSVLAAYMKKLDQDDALYNQYFEWKEHGHVTYHGQFDEFLTENMCQNIMGRVLADEAQEKAPATVEKEPLISNWDWWLNSCHFKDPFPIIVD